MSLFGSLKLSWGSEWHLIYIDFYDEKVEPTLAHELCLVYWVETQSPWIEAPGLWTAFFTGILCRDLPKSVIIIALPEVTAEIWFTPLFCLNAQSKQMLFNFRKVFFFSFLNNLHKSILRPKIFLFLDISLLFFMRCRLFV